MFQKKLSMNKRRGVSNIIGSLIVLAIVASVGSVILFQGLNQINAFNYDLTLHDAERVNELREDIIFEHVRFDPTDSLPNGNNLHLFVANIGSVDTQIVSVSMVKIDTQELIFSRAIPNADEGYIPIEDHTEIILDENLTNPQEANLTVGGDNIWNSTNYGALPFGTDPAPFYKITVGTAKGNFYEKVVQPWNG